MDAVTIEHRRLEIAKIALNSTDEKMINKLFLYAKKLSKKAETYPCQMTEQELSNSVDRAIEQYNNGKTVSHEEFLKKRTQWL
ncbi:MAG: hypothetical protein Q4G63_07135 [Bacteroidia bacterium]|nr:hypothetical protein [Bacteroidia bacterium]